LLLYAYRQTKRFGLHRNATAPKKEYIWFFLCLYASLPRFTPFPPLKLGWVQYTSVDTYLR
jgi:hypothetical protein